MQGKLYIVAPLKGHEGSPPLARGRHFKSYIYTRPLPFLAYTLFYFLPGDTENNRLLSLGASPSPKFFHITISLLGNALIMV